MKLKLMVLAVVAFFGTTFGQQVDREIVIMEMGTGTWCGYCPGAAMGADDMIENGHNVGIVEYHNGDNYENNYGNSRLSYYGVTGFPTTIFDGLSKIEGGNPSQSMYGSFLPKYNARINVPTSFEIDMVGSNSGMEVFNIEVTCRKVAESNASNLKLHVVLTESDIPENWGGLNHLDFVERAMYPNQYGTELDFSSTNEQSFSFSITPETGWNVENCELVMFIQDNSSKEIHQGKKIKLTEITGNNQIDMSVSSIENLADKNCFGKINPIIKATNFGLQTITSFDVNYKTNNGATQTYNWTGTILPGEKADVELPEIEFDVLEENTFEAEIVNPNNQTDEYLNNNSKTQTFANTEEYSKNLKLMLRTDNAPQEISWEIKNSAGEVLFSGGPYEQANTFVEPNTLIDLPANDCYSFAIYDSGNNGFSDGQGMVKLYTTSGDEILKLMNVNYGSKKERQFTAKDIAANDIDLSNEINIYPNPTLGAFSVSVMMEKHAEIDVAVFDASGKAVYRKAKINGNVGDNNINIPAEDFESGLYLVKVSIDGVEKNHKVIIK